MTLRLLIATLALAALPAAASEASTVELRPDGTLSVRAAADEANDVRIEPAGAHGLRVRDRGAAPQIRGRGCRRSGAAVVCATGVARVAIALGDGNDRYSGRHDFDMVVDGGAGDDTFDPGAGADVVRGGSGYDSVSYADRTAPVVVTLGSGAHDDGEAGEGDDIAGVERVVGGGAGDTIAGHPGSRVALRLLGGAGDDALTGADGDDVLQGGPGMDSLIGGRGDDRMLDGDGAADELDCGAGRVDTIAGYDEVDTLDGCENFGLGVSQLNVSGSEVELSWTHPTSWRKLRRLVLYVLEDLGADGDRVIGEVHINVRHPRIETAFGVEVARGGRITRHGKTVTARFTLEIAPGWEGSKLAYELEAIDLGGHPDSHGPLE